MDMQKQRTYSKCLEQLTSSGLRPTKQRLGLARLLFEREHFHVTAEQLHKSAQKAHLKVSLATVYNTLNQFSEAGLLREVVVESGRSYFDTNVASHHHFYNEITGELSDIPADVIKLENLPNAPQGQSIKAVDVIVRLGSNS